MAKTQTTISYLDSYCERAGSPALMGEPLNAVTNLFFILAAVVAALAVRKTPGRRIDLWLMVAALFAIGIGSGLWHLHPNGATVLMDVIPITLFINIYLVSALRRLFHLPWKKVALWWWLYFIGSFAAQIYLPPGTLNGTVMYLPTYAAMVVLTFAAARRDRSMGSVFAIVTTVWSISLIFRTIDPTVCPQLPLGTHFLWHTLNAWVLWRLLKLITDRARVPAA